MSMVTPLPSASPTPAEQLATNIDALHKAGHNNLEIPVQVALASTPQPTNVILDIADKIKQTLKNNTTALDHFFSDPQQSSIPSMAQRATNTVTSHFGNQIFMENHVSKIQQDMIDAGYAPKNSVANGLWGPEWTSAISNARYAKLTAPGSGNAPAKSTVQHALDALTLSRNANVLIEVVKSMPRSVLQLMGDVVSGKSVLSSPLTSFLAGDNLVGAGKAIAQFGAKPENRTSTATFVKKAQSNDQIFNDLITVLTFIPAGKLALGIKEGVVEAKTGKILSAEMVKPKYTLLNSIVASSEAGSRGLLSPSTKAIINKPILKQLYWGIDKTIVQGIAKTAPLQIAIRDTLAQRLRLPVIRAANKIGFSVMGAGLKEQVLAGAESKIGDRQGPLDTTVYGVAPIAVPIAAALDLFSLQMNPTMGAAKKATTVKDIIGDTSKTAQAIRKTFDDTGILRAWQKANPDIDYAGLVAERVAQGGHESDILVEIGQQVNQIAIQQAMKEMRNTLILDGSFAKMNATEKELWANETIQAIYKDADNPLGLLQTARQTLAADQNALETGFRQVGVAATSKTTAAAKTRRAGSNFNQKLQANAIMNQLLDPENVQHLITPDLLTQFGQANKAAAKAAGQDFWATTKPVKLYGTDSKAVTEAKQILDDATKAEETAKANAASLGVDTQGIFKPITKQDIAKKIATEEQRAAQEAWNKTIGEKRKATLALNKIQPQVEATEAVAAPLTTPTAEFAQGANIETPAGAIGLAVLDTLTSQKANKLYNELSDTWLATKLPSEKAAIKTKILQTLLDEFGYNVYNLGDSEVPELLKILGDQASKLAADLYVTRNAPEEVKNLVKQLAALGYKPVYGTDIGHVFNPSAQFTDLGAANFTKTAKVARSLGISPRLSDSQAVSARTAVETQRSLQEAIDGGKIKVFPSFNADRLLTYIRNNVDKTIDFTFGQIAVMESSRKAGLYDVPIKRLIEQSRVESQGKNTLTEAEAWDEIRKAKRGELGLREINYKDFIAILTRPMDKDIVDAMGLPSGTKFMDEQSARNTVQAIWNARTKVPLEMIGGPAKLEDIMYAGFAIGNKEFGKNAMKLASLPSTLFNLRTRVRYQESIVFAFRRMFKTAAKGITENIPPVMYPEAKMEEMGIANEAAKIHERIFEKNAVQNAFLDDAERVIKQADFYNLYNPIASEQWAGYWLSKQGFSDAEILKKVENIMGYGERTAAERSLNAIFFPFSFNKTVMRQFGKFFLTSPGKSLMVSGVIDLYDQINGPELKKWLEDNAPLIKQLELLNPLEHGIGLGGAGGINAPYLQGLSALMTVLGPKKIDYGSQAKNDATLTVLKQYVPMIKEFSDLFLGPQSQGHIFEGQVQSTLKTILDLGSSIGKPKETDLAPRQHKNMPIQAQQTAAWEYRTKLITGLTKILDYNYKNPDNRAVWPDWIPTETGLVGLPINKATIGQLVHYKYPAWDNALSAVISQQKATEANRFIGEITARNPKMGADYRIFENAAKRVSDAVAKDSVTPENLVKITDGFRAVAIDLATKDSNFADFYKTHYERLFGPLEGLTK